MEVKNSKKTKLTGLFGKYILGFTAIVILLAFFCFFVMIGTVTMIGGLLLPANHAEQVLAENGDKIRNADMVTEDLIPAGTFYGVFSADGKFLYGNFDEKEEKIAWEKYRKDNKYAEGKGYYCFFRRKNGEVCITKYFVEVRYANEKWNQILPPAEQLTTWFTIGLFVILTVASGFALSRCFARRMRRQLEGLCEATEKIAASDLEFESRPSDIQEIGDVMMSLEKMKAALKDSLQQQWESEQQKNRQISALAHDIKTPLTVVRGNAELLAEGELKEEDQECVLEILKNAAYMEQYLDSMRQVLRGREQEEPHKMVSAEKLTYKLLEEAEAIGTAEKIPVIMGREHTGKRKDKDFSRLLEDETENTDEILCCMDEVMRAWKNILGNALEHTDPAQGIQIEIGTEKVSDNQDSLRKYLVASVRDYGSGFSDQALIYGSEPFFSGDDSRHDRKHQGLGLSIADTFMKKQGGFLKYGNSVEGDGAEVSLWIKIADEKIN